MMVEVCAPLSCDKSRSRQTEVHAVVHSLVIKKSRPDPGQHHDRRSRIPADSIQEPVKQRGYDKPVHRMHKYLVAVTRGHVMQKMRAVNDFTCTRILDRKLNVK